MLSSHQSIDVCVKKRVCVVGKLPRIGRVLFNWSFFAAFMKITVMDNGQIPQERLQDSPTTCRCHPIDPLPFMGRRPSTKQKLKDGPLWINGNGFWGWFRLYHEDRNQPKLLVAMKHGDHKSLPSVAHLGAMVIWVQVFGMLCYHPSKRTTNGNVKWGNGTP